MGYYVPNKVKPICYNCPYRTNKYCGLLTEHDYLGDYPLNFDPYPYCPLVEVTGKIDAINIVEKEWRKECASDVVRCADCKYLEDGDWCTENIRPVCLDSFCSWASRKGNE